MSIIIGLLFAYLILPYIGLFNYNGFGGRVESELIILYTIHIVLEISIIILFLYSIEKTREKDIKDIKGKNINNKKRYFLSLYNIEYINKISILILLIIIFINMFIFGNYHILLGDIGRGEFRTTLKLGFIYLFLSFYAPGAILALNTSLYSEYVKANFSSKIIKKRLLIIFILSMFIGFLTGFKATAIIIAFMGLAGMSNILNFTRLFFIGVIFIFIMGISGYLFMNFSNFGQAISYLFKRATSIAVDGTVGIYNIFPNGNSESYMILLYNFGNHIASLLTGLSKNSIDFLYIDLGRLIGYLTYPSEIAKEALSGSFNLTITNFGEAIYLFGKNYFYFYTLFISLYLGVMLFLFRKSDISLKVILIVYFFTSLVIGGGRITNIFAITTFIYLTGVYILINLILNTGRIKLKINENS